MFLFDGQYPQLINNHIQYYFDGEGGVDGLRKEYPFLQHYKLVPLLLPVNVIFMQTKTGQGAQNSLRLRASHSLVNANIRTILQLCLICENKSDLRKYRNLGDRSCSLIGNCLTEFLLQVGINPNTVSADLKKAANLSCPPSAS